ncbi:uncharacterized protein LOC118406534 [Branchiostoma floridae]|uniref:Uncharacterized protein LOC118406534 n=1 Tax=Branchiostoma floridae TaxID=7739 RepID=A0A9J7HR16_BRAFL|nr:uncharacterized protein LOC118406534 [Branchiostoma floridae]
MASGGGGYEDQPPPDDPGLPRGFFVYGEDITAAFYTLLDITRTIIHLTDRFWEMLLCTWRFVSRCMEVVFFLTLPSSSQYCTRLRDGTIFYVIPPTGPVFPIRLTELSVERIYEQIAYSTGIPTTAFKLFKNSKEVRHFCQIANGGSVEITIPLLGGTRKRKRTDDVTPSTRHNDVPSKSVTDDSLLHAEEETCGCGGACNCLAFTSSKKANCDLPTGHVKDAVRSNRSIPYNVSTWLRSCGNQKHAQNHDGQVSHTSSEHFKSFPLRPLSRSPVITGLSPLRSSPRSPEAAESSPLRPLLRSPEAAESSPLRPLLRSPEAAESSPLRPLLPVAPFA